MKKEKENGWERKRMLYDSLYIANGVFVFMKFIWIPNFRHVYRSD